MRGFLLIVLTGILIFGGFIITIGHKLFSFNSFVALVMFMIAGAIMYLPFQTHYSK